MPRTTSTSASWPTSDGGARRMPEGSSAGGACEAVADSALKSTCCPSSRKWRSSRVSAAAAATTPASTDHPSGWSEPPHPGPSGRPLSTSRSGSARRRLGRAFTESAPPRAHFFAPRGAVDRVSCAPSGTTARRPARAAHQARWTAGAVDPRVVSLEAPARRVAAVSQPATGSISNPTGKDSNRRHAPIGAGICRLSAVLALPCNDGGGCLLYFTDRRRTRNPPLEWRAASRAGRSPEQGRPGDPRRRI